MDSYVDGDWVNSQSNLTVAMGIKPKDGPLHWMQDYMENAKNLAPEDWRGMRDLDKKQSVPEVESKLELAHIAD